MAEKEGENIKKIFLSASIPDQSETTYFETSDRINIRDSVKALASVISSNGKLVYGGQPVITRLIHEVMLVQDPTIPKNIILYQSEYFKDSFPVENNGFLHKKFTPKRSSKAKSLQLMREIMISDHEYSAGVFIGGMEGARKEFELFIEAHPTAKLLPVASTGGVANIIYTEKKSELNPLLETELGYMSLFRTLLEF